MPADTGSNADWEEARRCPKCNQPGEEVAERRLPERHQGKVVTLACASRLCIQFGDRWIVQVKPDGTIPKRKAGTLKSFPDMTDRQIDYAKRDIADAKRIMGIREDQ